MRCKEDEPTWVEYYKSGQIKARGWLKYGKYVRDGDKPTYVEYYESGQVKIKKWIHTGIGFFYREGGKPTWVEYYESGQIKVKVWWKYGRWLKEGDKIFKKIKREELHGQ